MSIKLIRMISLSVWCLVCGLIWIREGVAGGRLLRRVGWVEG